MLLSLATLRFLPYETPIDRRHVIAELCTLHMGMWIRNTTSLISAELDCKQHWMLMDTSLEGVDINVRMMV